FISPLLPVLIEKLSLSLTQAGSLIAIMRIPALLNPFIGYAADRVSMRYFIILAPAITGSLISMIGFIDSYIGLAILLFITGISVAAFHAPAPAMIARISGRQVGKGMSFFMAAGELSRTVGPLLAVWAVSIWSLDGLYRLVVIGWVTSLILFIRLRNISARSSVSADWRTVIPALRTLYLPLAGILFFRNFMTAGLFAYLPTYMNQKGASLLIGGLSLSILELAGVAGALSTGTLSDRLGRRRILMITTLCSSLFLLLFLNVDGWIIVPVLLGLGFSALSAAPVMLAIVQDYLPENRAVGNGLFMAIAFLMQTLAVLVMGIIGDNYGLDKAYLFSALVLLLAIPIIFTLPKRDKAG
ncbi:MAG: MFS transporter, partial [Anaerolineales bacterium]|nr:MFS transporter [Anaerolineales bacterium]